MSGARPVHRITVPTPIESLDHYVTTRGGRGIAAAQALDPEQIIAMISDAGLRGRGGAGFPTGRKWATVLAYDSVDQPTTVVVNGAEGEPGTFKDRHILTTNPYQVIEGALIAALAVNASRIIVVVKATETAIIARLHDAIDEMDAAGWMGSTEISVCEGPNEYLLGEETALLEVIDQRLPFPRIAPPWRRGVLEITEPGATTRPSSNLSAHIEMAGATDAPPALVNNVETLANVAHILARGATWYRSEGTDQTPGTFVCTVTGDTSHAGIGEVIAGTTLRDMIDLIGGGPRPERTITGVLAGVSNKLITADLLDTPITYEDMQPLGIGPGSAGFIVFDDHTDMTTVAAGVARFLAVESCGQCGPCKQDGLTIADRLGRLIHNDATPDDLELVTQRLGTVANGARCFLASQQQLAVGSILEACGGQVQGHLDRTVAAVDAALISEVLDVTQAGAVWDEHHLAKQPDWTFEPVWSGQSPADRYRDHLLADQLPD